MEIFKLFGSIFVDNEKANQSIDSTDQKAEGLGGKLLKGIGTAAKWGAAIAGAATAAGAGMLALANKTAETADFIDKLSERTGISREELQRWKYAAEQSDADIGKLEVGVKKLSEAMDGASNGSKANVEAFNKLGISLDDLKNKSQDQIFEDVMYALAEMPQGAERNALGNKMLGKSFTELLPLLNAGADGMDELKNRADDLNLVMSEDSVVSAVKFGDTLADLKMAFGAIFTHLGSEFIPIFQQLADWILQYMPVIKEITSEVFTVIGKVVTTVFTIFKDNILPIFSALFDWVQDNMPTIKSVVTTVFDAIWRIVESVWKIFKDNLIPILKGLYDFVKPTFPIISGVIETAFKVIIGAVELGIKVFERVTSAIKTAIDWLGKWNKTEAEEKEVTVRETKVTSTSGSSNKLDRYASGTDYAPGGWAIVGEKGPELMYVPQGSKIIPNEDIGMVSKVEHSGTIRVEGVNNKNELAGVVDLVMGQLRREVRGYV